MRAGLSRAFWRLNRRAWQSLPNGARNRAPARVYGAWLHGIVRRHSRREMYFGTFFLRNRPALELMRRLAAKKPPDSTLRVAVLGCSIGVEVYSILWTLRSAMPELNVMVHALDTSAEVVDIGKAGVYGPEISDRVRSSIFERLSPRELQDMFDWEGNTARVKGVLREGIEWAVDDACDPDLVARIGLQDLVVASNFLCHMHPADADACLRTLARLVRPGGHVFVTGVDVDVRADVARDLGWEPVDDLLEEIHEGDPSVRGDWPWHWWGLEPLDRRRPDWRTRYAAVFRIVGEAASGRCVGGSAASTE